MNQEYQDGTWDYLWSLSEFARFSVVAGYCRFLRPGGSILEVGCGEGVLAHRLDRTAYKRYVGIDLSQRAIDRARARLTTDADARVGDPPIAFIVADAASYQPLDAFDVIIFNESLHYFEEPVAVVQRYDRYLAENGVFIASIYRRTTTLQWNRIWRWLSDAYEIVDRTTVTNAKAMTWDIGVLTPRRRSAG